MQLRYRNTFVTNFSSRSLTFYYNRDISIRLRYSHANYIPKLTTPKLTIAILTIFLFPMLTIAILFLQTNAVRKGLNLKKNQLNSTVFCVFYRNTLLLFIGLLISFKKCYF